MRQIGIRRRSVKPFRRKANIIRSDTCSGQEKRNENKQIVRNVHALAFRDDDDRLATGRRFFATPHSPCSKSFENNKNVYFSRPGVVELPLIRQVKEIHRAHSSAHMCSLLALITSVGGKCSSCKTVERVPLCFLSSALLSLRHFVPRSPSLSPYLSLPRSLSRERSRPRAKRNYRTQLILNNEAVVEMVRFERERNRKCGVV